jgi:hypothetical protein
MLIEDLPEKRLMNRLLKSVTWTKVEMVPNRHWLRRLIGRVVRPSRWHLHAIERADSITLERLLDRPPRVRATNDSRPD